MLPGRKHDLRLVELAPLHGHPRKGDGLSLKPGNQDGGTSMSPRFFSLRRRETGEPDAPNSLRESVHVPRVARRPGIVAPPSERPAYRRCCSAKGRYIGASDRDGERCEPSIQALEIIQVSVSQVDDSGSLKRRVRNNGPAAGPGTGASRNKAVEAAPHRLCGNSQPPGYQGRSHGFPIGLCTGACRAVIVLCVRPKNLKPDRRVHRVSDRLSRQRHDAQEVFGREAGGGAQREGLSQRGRRQFRQDAPLCEDRMKLRELSIRRLQRLAMSRQREASCGHHETVRRIAAHAKQRQSIHPPAHRLEREPERLRKRVDADWPAELIWRHGTVGRIGGLQSGVSHQRLDVRLGDGGHDQGVGQVHRLTTGLNLIQQEARGDAQYAFCFHRHACPPSAWLFPKSDNLVRGPVLQGVSILRRVGNQQLQPSHNCMLHYDADSVRVGA